MDQAGGNSLSEGGPVDAALADYFVRLDRGESVEIGLLIAAHPGCETGVRQFLSREDDLNNAMAALSSIREAGDSTDHGRHSIAESVDGLSPSAEIGPYRLLKQIGEGGMGSVWLAEQERPVRRHVALKLIRPGHDTKRIIARFEAERQVLAMMDHPNIARVFDAGVSADGRPYFAMELVQGIPFVAYCDQHRLTPQERLELFLPVCQAIQHAHQKGIIHRDIKPSNILVTSYDNRPTPKVIDFGLAKALEQETRLTDQTIYTELGQVVGTVQYMSPEQATLNALDIDTRSDIYSLGVLLYELLAGSTPLEKSTISAHSIFDLLKFVREEVPPRPSDRLSAAGETVSQICDRRQIEPPKLRQLLRGDLDWIVMKAIEKDRRRRYESAAAFADDVRRYLSDEPVQARPPSRLYLAKKFVQRHKVGVAATGLFLLATLLTVGGLAVSNRIIAEERNTTKKALRERELALATAKQQEQLAKANATKAREQQLLARRRLYAAQLNLAQQAMDDNEPARALDLLQGQRPLAGETDLRSFEWYYLWNKLHPGLRAVLGRNLASAYALDVSSDGGLIAVGGAEHGAGATVAVVDLWDADAGKLQETITIPEYTSVQSLAFSRNGRLLALGMADGYLRVRDVHQRRDLYTLDLSTFSHVRSIAWSIDGSHLAAGCEEGQVQIHDAATGKLVAALERHVGPVVGVGYSPDGKRLYSSNSWIPAEHTGRVLMHAYDVSELPPRFVHAEPDMTFSDISDDSRYVLGTFLSRIPTRMWDSNSRAMTPNSIPGYTTAIVSAFASNTDQVLTAGRDDRLAIAWDFQTGLRFFQLPHLDGVVSVKSIRSSNHWLSLTATGTIMVWDTSVLTGNPDPSTPTSHGPGKRIAKRFGADGQTLVLKPDVGVEPTVALTIDANSFPGMGIPYSLAKDRRLLAAVAPESLTTDALQIDIWDLDAGRVSQRVGYARAPAQFHLRLKLSPNGRWLAVRASMKSDTTLPILIYDLSKPGSAPKSFGPGTSAATEFAFSPDSRFLASAIQFGYLRLLDIERFDVYQLQGFVGGWYFTQSVAFSADTKLLAAGFNDGSVSIWDLSEVKMQSLDEFAEQAADYHQPPKYVLPGHKVGVGALAFFPKGKTLVTVSLNTLTLWDIESRQEQASIPLQGKVRSIEIGPEGEAIVTVHDNGGTNVLHGGSGELANAPVFTAHSRTPQ